MSLVDTIIHKVIKEEVIPTVLAEVAEVDAKISKLVDDKHKEVKITMPFSSENCKGEKSYDVRAKLKELGFYKIQFSYRRRVEGIFLWKESMNDNIIRISIDGNSTFEKGNTFSSKAQVDILCWRIKMPTH